MKRVISTRVVRDTLTNSYNERAEAEAYAVATGDQELAAQMCECLNTIQDIVHELFNARDYRLIHVQKNMGGVEIRPFIMVWNEEKA